MSHILNVIDVIIFFTKSEISLVKHFTVHSVYYSECVLSERTEIKYPVFTFRHFIF